MTTAAPETEQQEALQYWGYLFRQDKCGTDKLNRLLSGLASHINNNFEPDDSPDITPPQLAAFYKKLGGDYDILFVDTLPSDIAFIYKSLGCLHSLQPAPGDDGYGTPAIPALKNKGFVTWQTIQLLLGPEEHVPFLQKAVQQYDIRDPTDGSSFPKILPKQAFPEKPDQDMVQWYEGVAERLKKEAELASIAAQDPKEPSEDDTSRDDSADEKVGAARYFRDPFYRDHSGRPAVIRRFSRAPPPRSPREYIEDQSRRVAKHVRHIWSGNSSSPRRRSLSDRRFSDYDDGPTPTGGPPDRYSPGRRPASRDESFSSADPDSDTESWESGPSPRLRRRRSHEPPASPREYFPPNYEHYRRASADHRSAATSPSGQQAPSQSQYGPTQEPIFAHKVASLQPPVPYQNASYFPNPSRGPTPPSNRPGYDRAPVGVRYTKGTAPRGPIPQIAAGPSRRPADRYEQPSRGSDRRNSRDEGSRNRYPPVTEPGVSKRRYPVEAPWR